MEPISCFICKQTNHIPEGQMLIMATFRSKSAAHNTVNFVKKSHIQLAGHEILSGEFPLLIMQLHGIKDIVKLQTLYIESMCQQNNCLTFESISGRQTSNKLLSKLQEKISHKCSG